MKSLSPFVIIPTQLVEGAIVNINADNFPFNYIKNQIRNGDAKSHYVFNCDLNFSTIDDNQISEYNTERAIVLKDNDFSKVVNFFKNKIIPNVKYKFIPVHDKLTAETVMNLIEQYHPDAVNDIDLYAKHIALFSEYNVATARNMTEIEDVECSVVKFSDIVDKIGELYDKGEKTYEFYCLGILGQKLKLNFSYDMVNNYSIIVEEVDNDIIVSTNSLVVVDNRGNRKCLDYNIACIMGGMKQFRLVHAMDNFNYKILDKLPNEIKVYL